MSKSEPASLCVTVVTGPHAGMAQSFSPGVVRIGRGADNELSLPDDHTVSLQHARVYLEQGVWFLADCGSRNGVYLDLQEGLIRLEQPQPVADGCHVHLGATKVTIQEVVAPASAIIPEATDIAARRHTLQIRYEPGTIRYGFGGVQPLARMHTNPYSQAWVDGLSERLDSIMRLANLDAENAGSAAEALEALGIHLRHQLVPERVTGKLAELGRGALLVTHDSELLPVPWEWVRLKDHCWCEEFDMGRQVALDHASIQLPPLISKCPTILIAVNPTEDLDEAQAEGEAILRSLEGRENRFDAVFLSGSRVTVERLLAEMEHADIVYYFGHGQYDTAAPDRSGWRLSDGTLGVLQLQQLQHPPRLVFSNACESAREIAQAKSALGYADSAGVASRFLLAGVEAYVGALWPIHAHAAALFARSFFQRYLDGTALGAAVRLARLETRAELGGADLAWASYVLYGDPLRTVPRGPVSETA